MSKYQEWWDGLDPQTKKYLEKQPLWHDKDLIKSSIYGAIIGFIVGFLLGYEVAFKPIIQTVRPLIG